MRTPELLPYPRSLRLRAGHYLLPQRAALYLSPDLPRGEVILPIAERLRVSASEAGAELQLITGAPKHPWLAIKAMEDPAAGSAPESYTLDIDKDGITVTYREAAGLRAAAATLRQLFRQYGRRMPCLRITDHPDFPRRGVMLDISRGRVPNLNTLLELVEVLADFKINEFQVYTEHTFGYRNYQPVWEGWAAVTAEEILLLDQRCRELGIDLVPNQNSFGHMRYWLEYPPLRPLAEVDAPYQSTDGTFMRYPSTLAPNHPGTLPFIRELYDELLPNFTSKRFNVGCDETFDLGRGQSREICEKRGKHKVYVDFLNAIHKEVSARGRRMMFWGDIILHEPRLLTKLPKDTIALNWGYEANHPFGKETETFAASGLPFYVCPGTSSWMTLIGRQDNALANLRAAAENGVTNGATGYLNTDWGDGGHPQPLAVSWLPYLAGAALSWCLKSFKEEFLLPVLSRDVFNDPTGCMAKAALGLGLAHKKLHYMQPNATPLGSVIAAPLPKTQELMCRDGLKNYMHIEENNVRATLDEIERQQSVLAKSKPASRAGATLRLELRLASAMAAESCKIMLWQQALSAGRKPDARALAKSGIAALEEIDSDFRSYWPMRNKGDTSKSTPFLRWRINDYKSEALHFTKETEAAK